MPAPKPASIGHVQCSVENQIVADDDFVACRDGAEFKVQNGPRVQRQVASQRQRADAVAAGRERAAGVDDDRAEDETPAAERAAAVDGDGSWCPCPQPVVLFTSSVPPFTIFGPV